MKAEEFFRKYPDLEASFLDFLEDLELNANENLSDVPATLDAIVNERANDGEFREDGDGRIRFYEGLLNNPHNTCAPIAFLGEEWGFEP